MTTLANDSKRPTAAEIKAAKKANVAVFFSTVLDTGLIYLAIVAGVLLTESAMDLGATKALNFFTRWSWQRFIVSAMIAGASMTKMDYGGDLRGKRKNIKRRIGMAFGQGAALRSIIEWMALLFAMVR